MLPFNPAFKLVWMTGNIPIYKEEKIHKEKGIKKRHIFANPVLTG
jgi:hypothetical protein